MLVCAASRLPPKEACYTPTYTLARATAVPVRKKHKFKQQLYTCTEDSTLTRNEKPRRNCGLNNTATQERAVISKGTRHEKNWGDRLTRGKADTSATGSPQKASTYLPDRRWATGSQRTARSAYSIHIFSDTRTWRQLAVSQSRSDGRVNPSICSVQLLLPIAMTQSLTHTL